MSHISILQNYWELQMKQGDEFIALQNKKKVFKKHNKTIKKTTIHVKKIKEWMEGDHCIFIYQLLKKYMIEDQDRLYHEQQAEWRKATCSNVQMIIDEEISNQLQKNKVPYYRMISNERSRQYYDRREAVRYAERWWNDSNPNYPYFEDNDCTNYISQCLRAGGIPMVGQPNRNKGWWMGEDNWSFSWSVAHAFRWYLSSDTNTFHAKLTDHPSKLQIGDVICYDFEGDGRWDHSTIVVAKDSENMPLVNAHTNNSRNRYWTYEDSLAWTEACQYRFFLIGD